LGLPARARFSCRPALRSVHREVKSFFFFPPPPTPHPSILSQTPVTTSTLIWLAGPTGIPVSTFLEFSTAAPPRGNPNARPGVGPAPPDAIPGGGPRAVCITPWVVPHARGIRPWLAIVAPLGPGRPFLSPKSACPPFSPLKAPPIVNKTGSGPPNFFPLPPPRSPRRAAPAIPPFARLFFPFGYACFCLPPVGFSFYFSSPPFPPSATAKRPPCRPRLFPARPPKAREKRFRTGPGPFFSSLDGPPEPSPPLVPSWAEPSWLAPCFPSRAAPPPPALCPAFPAGLAPPRPALPSRGPVAPGVRRTPPMRHPNLGPEGPGSPPYPAGGASSPPYTWATWPVLGGLYAPSSFKKPWAPPPPSINRTVPFPLPLSQSTFRWPGCVEKPRGPTSPPRPPPKSPFGPASGLKKTSGAFPPQTGFAPPCLPTPIQVGTSICQFHVLCDLLPSPSPRLAGIPDPLF